MRPRSKAVLVRTPLYLNLQDLDTERPVLTIGPCVFHGQHQHMIGTAAVFDTARAVPGSAGPGLREGSMDAMPVAPPVASLTRRAIVFRRVTGDVTAITLKRTASRLRGSS